MVVRNLIGVGEKENGESGRSKGVVRTGCFRKKRGDWRKTWRERK